MKKFLSIVLTLAFGLSLSSQVFGIDVSNGRTPSIGAYGGTLIGTSMLQMGTYPGAQVMFGIPLQALVNITQGQAVVLVAGKGCSLTTTVGDPNFIGFAVETTAFNATCQVARYGTIRANIGTSTVANDRLVTSANPGFLTPSSAVVASSYTSVSGSPIAARAFVTYTYVTYSPSVLVVIGDK